VTRPNDATKTWDEARCIREIRKRLLSGDLHSTVQAINRLECWYPCVAQFTRSPRSSKLGDALMGFWMTYGYWSIPRGLKADLPIFVDALKRHLPAYSGPGLTLFRGQVEAYHLTRTYGIAWTSDLEAAKRFADNRNFCGEGDGIVLQIEAPPEMIVAAPTEHSAKTMQEYEYIIDPRMIQSVEVVYRSLKPHA